MILVPQVMLQPFDKWVVDFVGPIISPGKRIGAWYIIIVIDYLTRWEEAALVTYYTTTTATRFLFENVLT